MICVLLLHYQPVWDLCVAEHEAITNQNLSISRFLIIVLKIKGLILSYLYLLP